MLPKVLTSNIIRNSRKNKKHGGLYLVDLETGTFDTVSEYQESINWIGRGLDRGLRGLAFYKDMVVVVSAYSIILFDKQFNIIDIINHDCLKFCHETYVYKDVLYITSTGHNSIILFDLKNRKFLYGIKVRGKSVVKMDVRKYIGVKSYDSMHINSVFCDERGIFISGTNRHDLLLIDRRLRMSVYCKIPPRTHNCYPMGRNKIIMNDTDNGRIVIKNIKNNRMLQTFNITRIPRHKMVNGDITARTARQPFARGLTRFKRFIIGGSSPGMISVYNMKDNQHIKNILISNDVCLAIHGLEVWPFS